MCIVEPKAEPYSNFIRKFEPESNLILVEPELEPEPCDIGSNNKYALHGLISHRDHSNVNHI